MFYQVYLSAMIDASSIISSCITFSSAILLLHHYTDITKKSWEIITKDAIKKKYPDLLRNVNMKLEALLTQKQSHDASTKEAYDEYNNSYNSLKNISTRIAIIFLIFGVIINFILYVCSWFWQNGVALERSLSMLYCVVMCILLLVYSRKLNKTYNTANTKIVTLLPTHHDTARKLTQEDDVPF
jgi:hypothetical protein